jgi:hypothetical protein
MSLLPVRQESQLGSRTDSINPKAVSNKSVFVASNDSSGDAARDRLWVAYYSCHPAAQPWFQKQDRRASMVSKQSRPVLRGAESEKRPQMTETMICRCCRSGIISDLSVEIRTS